MQPPFARTRIFPVIVEDRLCCYETNPIVLRNIAGEPSVMTRACKFLFFRCTSAVRSARLSGAITIRRLQIVADSALSLRRGGCSRRSRRLLARWPLLTLGGCCRLELRVNRVGVKLEGLRGIARIGAARPRGNRHGLRFIPGKGEGHCEGSGGGDGQRAGRAAARSGRTFRLRPGRLGFDLDGRGRWWRRGKFQIPARDPIGDATSSKADAQYGNACQPTCSAHDDFRRYGCLRSRRGPYEGLAAGATAVRRLSALIAPGARRPLRAARRNER
jgi:hypothetical protein